MGSQTYKTRALVLKKTKLREKDLIVAFLDEQGTLGQAVAKGARKPGGSHGARLELFSLVDIMLARGKSLDVVCEARLVDPSQRRSLTLEQTACSAPVAEILALVAQEDLAQPRLFAMAQASFDALGRSSQDNVLLLCAASLWKIVAQAGFRPHLDSCLLCGEEVPLGPSCATVGFSLTEGGLVCSECSSRADTIAVDSELLAWCSFVIRATFDQIAAERCDNETAKALMSLVRSWVPVHMGRTLKSIDFIFASGLFD